MKSGVSDYAVFFLLILLTAFVFFRIGRGSAANVSIVTPSASYCYSLSQNGVYTMQGAEGLFCIEIKNGEVRVIETSCKEKTCMNYSIHKTGQSIVCLPNRIVVTLSSGSEVDDVAY